jgi:hypothetical protein
MYPYDAVFSNCVKFDYQTKVSGIIVINLNKLSVC